MNLPCRVGVVGCGSISSTYLRNCRALPNVEVIACADLDESRALARAREFTIPRACRVDDLLADPDVDIVLNLTVPTAHRDVSLRALRAGKHVYSEKPLATDAEDGRRILAEADARGRLVGCAPDTFMGAALQTARAVLDRGDIGLPVGASAAFLGAGMESWHPNPEFFYQPGAGPLFDMGPYYLTHLVALLGDVSTVSGSARATFQERTVGSAPRAGTTFAVGTPTYVAALLEFSAGPIGTLVTTFDAAPGSGQWIEVHGREGTMRVPDPNRFDGTVLVRRTGSEEWHVATSDSPYTDNCRGIGLNDMATALAAGGTFRASGTLALHVLEIMEATLAAAADGRRRTIVSRAGRPAPMPIELSFQRAPEGD